MEPTAGMLIVFGLIFVALLLFISEVIPSDITAICVIVALALLGPYTKVNAREAILRFANPAMITILSMYIISRGVQMTGLVDVLGDWLARITAGSESKLMTATVGTTGGLAGFVNNTPVVAVFIPMISDLADRLNLSVSRFLMPLSFAAMLGGTLTLLGTSTNLLASDFARRTLGEPLLMFVFALLGFIVFVIGGLYLILVAPWLLTDRVDPNVELAESYELDNTLFALRPTSDSSLIGREVGDAFSDSGDIEIELLELHRGGETYLAPSSDREIKERDILIIRLNPSRLKRVKNRYQMEGVSRHDISDDLLEEEDSSIELNEFLVLQESPLVGGTLKELKLSDRYHMKVLAIRRQGELMTLKMDEVSMGAGDESLLLGDRRRPNYWGTRGSPVDGLRRIRIR